MGGISIVSKMLSGRILQSFGSSQSFLNFENSICLWVCEDERLGNVRVCDRSQLGRLGFWFWSSGFEVVLSR